MQCLVSGRHFFTLLILAEARNETERNKCFLYLIETEASLAEISHLSLIEIHLDSNENGKTENNTSIAVVEISVHTRNTNVPKLTALKLAKTTQPPVTSMS